MSRRGQLREHWQLFGNNSATCCPRFGIPHCIFMRLSETTRERWKRYLHAVTDPRQMTGDATQLNKKSAPHLARLWSRDNRSMRKTTHFGKIFALAPVTRREMRSPHSNDASWCTTLGWSHKSRAMHICHQNGENSPPSKMALWGKKRKKWQMSEGSLFAHWAKKRRD